MNDEEAEDCRIFLEDVEEDAEDSEDRNLFLNAMLKRLVAEGALYEAEGVAKMVPRELNVSELKTIADVCDKEGLHDEANDAREMLRLLEDKNKDGLRVVE